VVIGLPRLVNYMETNDLEAHETLRLLVESRNEGLGDKIERVARPIAKTIDYIFGTDIQGCKGCEQMRDDLNAGMSFTEAVYDRFWRSSKKQTGDSKMTDEIEEQLIEYQLIVAVMATDIKDALDKMPTGKVISVNPRPQGQFGAGGRVSPGGQTIVRSN
jgi:hypothetical protein